MAGRPGMEGRRHKKEVNDVFASITQNSKRIQSRNLFNYNIFLIGFMGAGKSTISDYLKNALGYGCCGDGSVYRGETGNEHFRYL